MFTVYMKDIIYIFSYLIFRLIRDILDCGKLDTIACVQQEHQFVYKYYIHRHVQILMQVQNIAHDINVVTHHGPWLLPDVTRRHIVNCLLGVH